jgi:hypothetical protein
MTQQFRTFTQRLTDDASETTRIFNVRAKTIVDRFGNDVVDLKGNKIWFPETFDPTAAITFGKSLASEPTMAAAQAFRRNVMQGGPWDLQRSYNGQSNAPFASLFTNAASYAYGLIGAAAGFSPTTLMAGAGAYNVYKNPKTAGLNFGNNPNNPPFISKGVRDYFDSSFGPPATIPDNSFQGNPAFAPADRFKSGFDRSFEGSSENTERLIASPSTGSITPSAGFTDPTNANRYANSFPQAPDKMVASAEPHGWLFSMIRNGEVERFTKPSGGALPSAGGAPDGSGTFDERFGTWRASPTGGARNPFPPLPRGLRKGSAAPDGAAWTSAQGAAATPTPLALNASGPGFGSQIDNALNTAGNRAVPGLTRVGKFVGNSLIAPAEGASPSGLLLRDPTAPNLPGDDTQGIDSSKPERRLSRRIVNPAAGGSGDSPYSPAPQPQESQGPLSLNDAYLLYLARQNASQPQVSMSDPAPPTAPFDATNPNPPPLGAADWIASLAGVDPQNPTQFASSPQTRGLAGSSYGGNPMQPWPDTPVGSADNSAASGNDNRHWYVPLGGLLWDGNKTPARSTADAGVPASPIDSTDDANYSGGLLGRYLALAGLDPQNPTPLDDEQEQANLRELDARFASTGDIRDAVALYNARKANRARGALSQA